MLVTMIADLILFWYYILEKFIVKDLRLNSIDHIYTGYLFLGKRMVAM